MKSSPVGRGFFLSMMNVDELYQIFLKSGGVETDSRLDLKNKIFFAFKGLHFDGNTFAAAAIEQGAVLAIVDNPAMATNEKIVAVDDVLTTLQDLARQHRLALGIQVIAITGSNGKTTTKELAHRVLSKKYHVNTTQGNFNNLLGLPLTILKADTSHDMMLLEMGSNAHGEIEQLCQIAMPDAGLITNIGNAHLEGFGGLDGVHAEKTALFEAVKRREGTIFVNAEDPYLNGEGATYTRSVNYSLGAPRRSLNECTVAVQQHIPFVILEIPDEDEGVVCQTQMMGMHNAMNCAAAAAIGFHFKISANEIGKALAAYTPADNRSQLMTQGTTDIYLDAYNANPDSMKQALSVLADWPKPHKIALLGDMKEVGDSSFEAHRTLVDQVSRMDLQAYYFVGSEMSAVTDKAFNDVAALGEHLKRIDLTDTVVLIKGSRSIGMERILKYLPVDFQ